MKLIVKHLKNYKVILFLNFVCVFGTILIELGLPTILAKMVNIGLLENNFDYIKQQGALMILIVVIGVIMNIGLIFFVSKITNYVVSDIRNDIFTKIQGLSHNEYEKISVSSLITRTTNDAYQIMVFLQTFLRVGLIAPMMFIFSLYMVIRMSLSLGVYVLCAIPFLLIAVLLIAKYSSPLSFLQQKNLDRVNTLLRENLSGLRVIKAFVNEKLMEKKFKNVNDAYATSSKKLFQLMSVAQPSFYLIFITVVSVIIWKGSVQIDAGNLQVGNLIAFIEYMFQVLYSFMMFASVFMMYPRTAVSASRIEEVLSLDSIIDENPSGQTAVDLKGKIEFENVSFAYPGNAEEPVLRNISFTANPGETVAFIGSTGSGKSTLIQLIPRLYDVSKGRILIDGINIRNYNLKSLRSKIGYIPQKAILFSGTISSNLEFGKQDATPEDMRRATDIAQATEFVLTKPEQFEERLSEGGTNFSGGQKQRLAIARALIRKPSIYVFDDSFSALDYKTDANLRACLKEQTTNSTILIVAQRVATIMHADKIIVLDKGEIVGIGTHRELLKSSGIYYDIAASQLIKEELN